METHVRVGVRKINDRLDVLKSTIHSAGIREFLIFHTHLKNSRPQNEVLFHHTT